MRSAVEIARSVTNGSVDPEALVTETFDAIERTDASLNAFLHLSRESALESARRIKSVVASGGDPGPLAGVPIAVKDNIVTAGTPTTCASRILRGHRPVYDATVVARITEAGGIVVGKTNMDEFGMGSSTENSAFGPTRNPWDIDRVPGGSSGGSAAAVAAGVVPLALGSDTGGSVRQPAAFCGVVGVKPTYGRVSRRGLVAYASSLDQIGLFSRTPRDAKLLFGAIAGRDPMDATSHDASPAASHASSIRIGVPRRLVESGLDDEVSVGLEAAIDTFRGLGAEVVEVPFVDADLSLAAYYVIACAEASSNLARYDGVRYGRRSDATDLDEMITRTRSEGFGREVRRRILLGTYVLSSGYYDAYYRRAMQVRRLIRNAADTALSSVDFIALPTSPTPAFRIGERTADPVTMYLSDLFTIVPNLTSCPALSLPAPVREDALPVGIQLMARRDEDEALLDFAERFRAETRFDERRPPEVVDE